MSKRDVFHNSDDSSRLPIHSPGLRKTSHPEGPWTTGLEHEQYFHNLANTASLLDQQPALANPEQGLQRLAILSKLRSMIDAAEATLLSDTLEISARLITENGAQHPAFFGDDEAERNATYYGVDAASVEVIRSNFIAEAALALRETETHTGYKLFFAEGLRNLCTATLSALTHGHITTKAAKEIVKQSQDLQPDQVHHLESVLLPIARTATDSSLAQRARRMHDRMNPIAAEARHQQAEETRGVSWWAEDNGMAVMQIRHTAPRIMAMVKTVNCHAAQHLDPEDSRTEMQRRADIVTDALLDGWPASDGAPLKTNLAVTIPAIELLVAPSKSLADLEGYGPIPMGVALELATKAPSFLRVLTDPWTGAPIDVGRKRYRPPQALRDLIRLRDQVCCFPGCNKLAENSEADHGTPWAHGGHTTRLNMKPLCKKHQMFKHALGWQSVYRPDGSVQWTSPNGVTATELPGSVNNVQNFEQTQTGQTPMLEVVMTDPLRRVLGWWDPPESKGQDEPPIGDSYPEAS